MKIFTLDDAKPYLINPNTGVVTNLGVIEPDLEKFGIKVGQRFNYDVNPQKIWEVVGFINDIVFAKSLGSAGIYTATPDAVRERLIHD